MELMIVVAIFGLLVAIAYPNYQDSVNNGRRVDAQGAVTGFASAMERHFTANNSYLGAGVAGADTGAPAIYMTQSPRDSGTKFYNLTIQAATATTYTLRATPINGQVGNGLIELLSTGQKRWDKDNSGDATGTGENNWNK
jgi:type IV pilus assembly protein PilE